MVKDKALKFFVLFCHEFVCIRGKRKSDPKKFIKRLTDAAKGLEFKNQTIDCVWESVNGTLREAFCEKESHVTLDILIHITTIEWCRHYPDEKTAQFFCMLGEFLIKNSKRIKEVVKDYIVCPHSKTGVTRLKRQFDSSSLIGLVDDLFCVNTDTITSIVLESRIISEMRQPDEKEREKEAAAVGRIISPFVCCMVDFVKTRD